MTGNLVKVACELISGWTGFELRSIAPERIRDFVERRSAQLGYSSAAAYLEDLKVADAVAAEPQRLINLVTNGLTHFWRDEPQLEALRAALVETAQRIQDRPIRVWCAGCSTGEEAYTVAMIAAEERISVKVLGTDINTEVLSHAALGRYSDWSLRRLSGARKDSYFRPHSNLLEVVDGLIEVVEFRYHSVTSRAPESHVHWDLILCRNVLIYLHERARERAAENFAAALNPDGYLLLGSSEQLMEGHELFRASRREGGFVYRHTQKDAGSTSAIILELDEESVPLLAGRDLDATQEIDCDAPIIELVQSGLSHLDSDLGTALACFEAAAGYDPFVLETYIHLAAALADAAPERAAEALQKALFLDPHHWYAAFELAKIHANSGERRRAKITFSQVLEGLDQRRRPLFDERLIGESLFHVEETREDVRAASIAALESLIAQ